MDFEKVNLIATGIVGALFFSQLVYGYSMGFVRLAGRYVKLIGAFVLAPIAAPLFYVIMVKFHVPETLSSMIDQYFAAYAYSKSGAAFDALNAEILGQQIEIPIDNFLSGQAQVISGNLIRMISYAGGFIIISLILGSCVILIDKVASLPVISSFNRLFGMGAAVLLCFLCVQICLVVISMLSFLPVISGVYEYIMRLDIVQWLYKVNPYELMIYDFDDLKEMLSSVLNEIERYIK